MHYADPDAEAKKVPFYLYLPDSLRPSRYQTEVPGSHKDIFPTLYQRILRGQTYLALGTDLFDPEERHCGFNNAGIIVANDGAFRLGHARSESNSARIVCQEQ